MRPTEIRPNAGTAKVGTSPLRDLGALYAPPRSPVIVDVPPIDYLMVDGSGAPDTLAWAEAIDTLRTAAGGVASEGPVEVLWHTDEADDPRWTLMVAVGGGPATLPEGVRSARLDEGWSAQLMVTGGRREIALRRLDRFVDEHGYRSSGPLHEIVLVAGGGEDDATRRCILRRVVHEL